MRAALPQADTGVTGCFAQKRLCINKTLKDLPSISREDISVSSKCFEQQCFDCFESGAKIALTFVLLAYLQKSLCTDQFDVKLSAPDPAKAERCRASRAKKSRGVRGVILCTQNEGLQWTGMDQCNGLPLGENGIILEGKR